MVPEHSLVRLLLVAEAKPYASVSFRSTLLHPSEVWLPLFTAGIDWVADLPYTGLATAWMQLKIQSHQTPLLNQLLEERQTVARLTAEVAALKAAIAAKDQTIAELQSKVEGPHKRTAKGRRTYALTKSTDDRSQLVYVKKESFAGQSCDASHMEEALEERTLSPLASRRQAKALPRGLLIPFRERKRQAALKLP